MVSWILILITLFGTVLAIRRKWYCFIIFTFTNLYWIWYNYKKASWTMMFLFIGYGLLNIYGAYRWKKCLK